MRHKTAPKRKILPDPKFRQTAVAKLINYVMRKGKKILAQRLVYGAFDEISKKTNKDPLEVFDLAIKNVGPIMEVRSRRIGGANYQIPRPVRGDRKLRLALHWIVEAAKNRKGKPMNIKLAEEIIAASLGEGSAVKKKEDVHRMAEANKAFAHFAKF